MSVEAVTALLGAGANPNARDESGHTPLHQAALSETGEAVTALRAAALPVMASRNPSSKPSSLAWLGLPNRSGATRR